MEALARRRDAILERWFERTVQSYPGETSRFLRNDKDPFRNPVGHTLREGLAILLDEVLGKMDVSRTHAALEAIVRLRAVQDFTPGQAVAFVFQLKRIARQEAAGGELELFDSRVDEMALLAFDLYMKCREKLYEIKADEARRRVYLLERASLKRGERP
jgi:hypothetical protein